jgi:hypothetical protein
MFVQHEAFFLSMFSGVEREMHENWSFFVRVFKMTNVSPTSQF